MARMGMGSRIIALFFIIIGLLVGGLVWFDFLGFVNANQILGPVMGLFGKAPVTVDIEDPGLLDTIRVRKQEEAVDLKLQEVGLREENLEKKSQDVMQRVATLDEREKAQEDREKTFKDKTNRYDDIRRNLEQNSKYLTSMPPADAVNILVGYDDQLLIDTLRITQELADAAGETSLVSVWLSTMAKEPYKAASRVADIQRKMTLKPQFTE